jgi:hypothetical protein
MCLIYLDAVLERDQVGFRESATLIILTILNISSYDADSYNTFYNSSSWLILAMAGT